MIRTRSRPFQETPRRTTSPLHRHAVTPIRRPPKRRRVGRSALAISKLQNRSSDSADSDHDNGVYRLTTQIYASSPKLRARKTLPRLRTRTLQRSALDDTMSPRKRKRSEEGSPSTSPGSGSWIETEDEMPEFMAEEDDQLLQSAPAYALHRLRKSELVRLWKVAGMWPGDDEMIGEENDEDLDMGKAQLVNGIISARNDSSTSSRQKSTPLDAPFSYKERNGHSSSTLTSPPDSSEEDRNRTREFDIEATPKAPRTRARDRLADPILLRTARKERLRNKGRTPKARPAGRERRKARFPPNVKSPEIRTARLARRSSTLSSHYTTTDGSADDDSTNPFQSVASNVRSTPLIRRLRPRKGSFVVSKTKSNASTEVDADAEDNGDDLGSYSTPSIGRRRSSSTARRARHERNAKLAALSALRQGDEASGESSWEEDDSPLNSPEATKTSTPPQLTRRASTRSGKSTSSARRGSLDTIDVDPKDDTSSARTTRSGKVFGDIRDSPEPDDESMEEDEEDGVDENFDMATATMSSLTRLRREELVKMCEVRSLEVGGTKPQLARALMDWRDENMEKSSTTSSQNTARPDSPEGKVVHAIASNSRRDGQKTPILLRTHIHGHGPVTPPRSDEDAARASENDLNLDLQELGLEDFTIKPEHLLKLEKIGSGGFKDVFVGKLRGRKVAISEFRGHLSEMDIRELKLLAEFRHPNIVRFRGICIPEDSSQVPCMLISELCENGDLYDYIRNVSPPPPKRVLRLMLDIAKGLEYLHLRVPSIIHRDCKSTNILITRGGVAKVGDFGLARVKHSTRSMIRSLVGTVNWQAPELWHPNPRYDYKVDVFSAALVYWEMLSGWAGEKKYPWEGHNEHYIYDAVGQKHRRPSLAGLRKHWGTEPVNLVERMWHQDPRERPTMSDVVADLEALIADCR